MSVQSIAHLKSIASLPTGLLYPHQADGVAFLISKKRANLPPLIKKGSNRMSDPVDDETSRRAAFQRLEKMFPTNRGLEPIFSLMANAHRYAIDYIAQAPVIVLAVTRGRTHIPYSERAFVAEQFRNLCESGAPLRDVMRTYGLPLPLRALEAGALTASRATVVRRLALMNPSSLAQIIPATRPKQNAWLQALEKWCDAMAVRSGRDRSECLFFEWAATHYPGVTYSEADGAPHMVDFALAHAARFNPRWTLDRARAEEQKWHAELAVVDTAEHAAGALDTVIDYTPLPHLREHAGLSFVALQTGKALRAEGAAMHHCVATYWKDVANGGSRIYSIRENGKRVATVELDNRLIPYKWGTSHYRMRQLSGPRNARPAPEVAEAVGSFVEEINKLAARRP